MPCLSFACYDFVAWNCVDVRCNSIKSAETSLAGLLFWFKMLINVLSINSHFRKLLIDFSPFQRTRFKKFPPKNHISLTWLVVVRRHILWNNDKNAVNHVVITIWNEDYRLWLRKRTFKYYVFRHVNRKKVNKITSLASSCWRSGTPKKGRSFQFLLAHKLLANQFHQKCVSTSIYFGILCLTPKDFFFCKRMYTLKMSLFFAMCCRNLTVFASIRRQSWFQILSSMFQKHSFAADFKAFVSGKILLKNCSNGSSSLNQTNQTLYCSKAMVVPHKLSHKYKTECQAVVVFAESSCFES